MENIVLKELAYFYYPKGIDSFGEKSNYIISDEYNRLSSRISFFEKEQNHSNLIKLRENLGTLFKAEKFIDATLYTWQDRCFNYQYYKIKNNKIISVCINISFLIPYYFISNLEVDFDLDTGRWLSLPIHSNNIEAKKKLEKSKIIIQENLNYNLFNDSYNDLIIENLSFQDIPLGKFTFYNAFFLNKLNIRI